MDMESLVCGDARKLYCLPDNMGTDRCLGLAPD